MFKLDHIGINTFNEKGTVEFYETLGYQVIEQCYIDIEENHVILMENPQGSRIEIAAFSPNTLSLARRSITHEGFNHYAFVVADIKDAYDTVRRWCIHVERILTDHRNSKYFVVTDPNGVKFEIIEKPLRALSK